MKGDDWKFLCNGLWKRLKNGDDEINMNKIRNCLHMKV